LGAGEGVVAMRDDGILDAVAFRDFGSLLSHVLELVLKVTHYQLKQFPQRNKYISVLLPTMQ
jgi:hypothetical protein